MSLYGIGLQWRINRYAAGSTTRPAPQLLPPVARLIRCIEAGLVMRPRQREFVHPRLREAEPLRRRRLRQAPRRDGLADRDHHLGARLHVRRLRARRLDRIPDAGVAFLFDQFPATAAPLSRRQSTACRVYSSRGSALQVLEPRSRQRYVARRRALRLFRECMQHIDGLDGIVAT